MCAKDSDDDDDDVSTSLSQGQQPLFSKDQNVFAEYCDRNMCIEGGRTSPPHSNDNL